MGCRRNGAGELCGLDADALSFMVLVSVHSAPAEKSLFLFGGACFVPVLSSRVQFEGLCSGCFAFTVWPSPLLKKRTEFDTALKPGPETVTASDKQLKLKN